MENRSKEELRLKLKRERADIFKSTLSYCKAKNWNRVQALKESGSVLKPLADHSPIIQVVDFDFFIA